MITALKIVIVILSLFTALGIAQLVDRHQVDLDTPVVRYIPELRLRDPQGFPPDLYGNGDRAARSRTRRAGA